MSRSQVPVEAGFLLGLGGFFLAHAAYLILFATTLRSRRIPRLARLYGAWWVFFVALLAPHARVLLVPIALYGAALGAVAILALTCNRWTALGGALFLVSDSFLGLKFFLPGFEFWQQNFVIMLTYLLAEGLIVWGAVYQWRKARIEAAALPVPKLLVPKLPVPKLQVPKLDETALDPTALDPTAP